MAPLDLSRLSGPDAVVALRSYPRRFRAAAVPVEGDPLVEEWSGRIGPEGTSALDTVVATANTWALLGRALHEVLVQDDPVLHAAVADPHERSWPLPPGTTVTDALDRLGDEADQLADAVERCKRDTRRYAKRQMTWIAHQFTLWPRIPSEALEVRTRVVMDLHAEARIGAE